MKVALENIRLILECGNYGFVIFLFGGFLCRFQREKKILAGLLGTEFLLYAAACIWELFKGDCLYAEIVLRIFAAILANVVLVSCIAWGLGKICSRIKNDFVTVCVLMILGSLFYFDIVLFGVTSWNGFGIEFNAWISKVFMILPKYEHAPEIYINPYNPFYVTAAHWQILSWWMFAEIAGLFMVDRRWKIGMPIFMAAVVFLGLSALPQNEYWIAVADETPGGSGKLPIADSLHKDKFYYIREDVPAKEEIEAMRLETDTFKVCEYDMEITPGRSTAMKVRMTLEDTQLEQYVFTLYHEYEIEKITDEKGNPMEYSVVGDYVTVYAGMEADGLSHVQEIYMEYRGATPVFMSETSYTYLPEYYRYYPLPGVWDVFVSYEPYYFESSCDYSKRVNEEQIKFHARVNADYAVYCNLEKVGNNEFEGVATGCTFLGGMCIGETQVGEARIVYPKLLMTEKEAQKKYQEIIELYGGFEVDLSGRDWIVASRNDYSYSNYCCGKEYFTGSFENIMYSMTHSFGFTNWSVEDW